MQIQENVSLKPYSTMRLGGNAKYLAEVHNKNELIELLQWSNGMQLPTVMIGEGSNIIWTDSGYSGLVIVNKISGYEVKRINTEQAIFTFGSGEPWDKTVQRTVELGYSGLEQLSYIPGTVGGTPVQNVGAYGQEISNVLVEVEAYDSQTDKFVIIPSEQCGFGYRTSRFKTNDKRRFFITAVSVKLTKQHLQPPFYTTLQQYFDDRNIREYSPAIVRQAVIDIRTSKLPDPNEKANNGSFFSNPIVSDSVFEKLNQQFRDIPHWSVSKNKYKLSAAWLIEQSGFSKGFQDIHTGMGLWPKQALVVVNNSAKSAKDLQSFKDKIIKAVETKFDITLEQEPETITNPSDN